jgi:hypothetical protein
MAHLCDMRAGKLVRHETFMDRRDVLEAVGLKERFALKIKLDRIFNNDVCGGVTPSVTQESDPAQISRRGSSGA